MLLEAETNKYCPGGNDFGAISNLITWVLNFFLSVDAALKRQTGVYRRPYFTGLRISTQTVSFITDNFSSFLTQKRTITALYTFLLISGPPSDFIEDVELWLARAPYL